MDGERRQAHGQAADDHDRQRQRALAEPSPSAVAELPELGDRRRRRLGSRRQRHRDGEGEDHGDQRRAGRSGEGCLAVRQVRVDPAEGEHRDRRDDEEAGHDREDHPAPVPEPGQPRHQQEQAHR
jgi:hypothetical protein